MSVYEYKKITPESERVAQTAGVEEGLQGGVGQLFLQHLLLKLFQL